MKNKNPFRNVVRMLCRRCKTDSHLIRNFPKMRKAVLVNIALESIIPSDFLILFALSQDLPDEV